MKIWQVAARGEGFQRHGSSSGFELSAFISAASPSEAFAKAVRIAKTQTIELGQAEHPGLPHAVINPEEIEEFSGTPSTEIDAVEIHWLGEQTA
jgi:hypothetical protein